jgi:hypothetical protein
MSSNEVRSRGGLVYEPGLDRVEEAVVSSHFMQELAANPGFHLYAEDQLAAKALYISAQTLYEKLIPGIIGNCERFCQERAVAAKHRARANHAKYGLSRPSEVGLAHFITEVMFDRQFLRGPRETCSRESVCAKVQERVDECAPIEMVLPALPFKFSTPLKTRGRLPDLGDVNFLIGLYEVVRTVELIYREGRPDLQAPLVRFVIVSDGSRFNRLVNEPDGVIEEYRSRLNTWIRACNLQEYITLLDYRVLLKTHLPPAVWDEKSALAELARREYAEALWPAYDPYRMAETFRLATLLEPDPEYGNPEGRFVSLLKSLIYTIKYRALEELSGEDHLALYRDLTSHIFVPYATLSRTDLPSDLREAAGHAGGASTNVAKEQLRQSMLREAWTAAIDYMAEIKSDRELPRDPIATCLPSHFRWTIHAKPGQLAIMTPTALGFPIQAWAGTAVFKRSKKEKNKIRLCTLPIVALEGVGATPVMAKESLDGPGTDAQPLFYIYPDISIADIDEFALLVMRSLGRKRTN